MKYNLKLIKEFEGCSLVAYKDPISRNGLPITIGYGNTFYKDGSPVKLGDKITQSEADELVDLIAIRFIESMKPFLKSNLNENQLSSILSLVWNIGITNFSKSTILKKINKNPMDPSISDEFKKWNKSGGRVVNGLVRRREAEAKLYFKI